MKIKQIVSFLCCTILLIISTGCKDSFDQSMEENVIWALLPHYFAGQSFADGVAAVQSEDGVCFINKAGTQQFDLSIDSVPIRFSEISPGFRNGVSIVQSEGNRHYLLRNGELSKYPYSESYWNLSLPYEHSLCPVEENGHYGLINMQDLWYIKPTYDLYSLNNDGSILLVNEKEGQSVFVKPNGERSEIKLTGLIGSVGEEKGFLCTEKQYINLDTGKIIDSLKKYEEGKEFSEGIAAVKMNGKYGYVNEAGENIIDFIYKTAYSFHSGFAVAEGFDDKFYIINKKGNALEINYDILDFNFHEDLLIIRQDNKCGIIDNTGKLVLPPQYTNISWNEYGYFLLYDGKKRGVYDPIHSTQIEPQYDKVFPLSAKRLLCEKNGKIGIIDMETGITLLENKYFWRGDFGEGLIVASKSESGPWGFIDYNGDWIILPQFESANGFREGLAQVYIHNECGYAMGYIANPLIYTEWHSDENVRAKDLGLTSFPISDIVECLFSKLNYTMSQELKSYVDQIKGKTEYNRKEMAELIQEIAKSMGENTSCLLSEYDDVDPDSDSYGAISYATSIGVLEILGRNFYPAEIVSADEIEKIFLRLYEYMLDSYERQHPQFIRLAHSF